MPTQKEGISKRQTMMGTSFIQVLIIDNATIVRRGLKTLLEQYPGIKVVGEVANGMQSIELTARLQPDVVLIDPFIPRMYGIKAIQKILAIHPDQHLIVLTASTQNEYFIQAVKAGAQGYFTKDLDPKELAWAIQSVYEGKPTFESKFVWEIIRPVSTEKKPKRHGEHLTQKELGVLQMLCHGMTDQDIADELVVEPITVRSHINQILKKLHVENRVQAVLYSLQSGLVPKSAIARLTVNEF
jgi:two-component system, NarL family, response regulator DegU